MRNAAQVATTTVAATSHAVRRGTATSAETALPVPNSALTASTPRTTSASWAKPKPVSATSTATSARDDDGVPAAASHPNPAATTT